MMILEDGPVIASILDKDGGLIPTDYFCDIIKWMTTTFGAPAILHGLKPDDAVPTQWARTGTILYFPNHEQFVQFKLRWSDFVSFRDD